MKKTLFILFILLCSSTYVHAETKEYSSEYYLEGENPSIYPFKAEDHFRTTEFSDWSITAVENKPNRVIEERYVTKYRNTKPIRYLHLNNFVSESNYFEFAEFNIFINDMEIPYQIIRCDHCNSAFFEYATDNNTNLNYCSIYKLGYMVIDLGDYYSIEELKFDFYMFDVNLNPKSFDVYVSDSPVLGSNSFYKKIMIYTINNPNRWEMYRYRVVPDSSWLNGNEALFSDFVYGETDKEETYSFDIFRGYEYRYYDVMFRYYKVIEDPVVIEGPISTKAEALNDVLPMNESNPSATATSQESILTASNTLIKTTATELQSSNVVDDSFFESDTRQVITEAKDLAVSSKLEIKKNSLDFYYMIASILAVIVILIIVIKKIRKMSHTYKD